MAGFITLLDFCFAALGLYLLQRLVTSKKQTVPLPPGPKPLPVIGNVLDMPSSNEWKVFRQWGEKWGGIVHINVLGQHIVVLNSWQACMDMFEKKGGKYSDRPILPMGGELVGWKNTLVLVPYGDRHRNYRRFFHKKIGTQTTMKQFHPAEEIETHKFLRRVLAKPSDLSAHVRHTAGAIILRISHGYEVKEHNDPFVELADKATEQFSLSTAPGHFLVDIIPALQHVPDWVPGANFKRIAKAWNQTLNEMVDKPHNFVKQQMAAGVAPVSFTSELLEDKDVSPGEEFDVKWSAASLYSGGADTTVSAIYSFFLAMVLHPEVQKKAQAEIDSVVGSDRLPNFHDREQLPYIEAVAKEVLRWNAVVPLGIAHRTTEDDIHEGYFIPKGTLCIPNIEGMLKDPRTYPNPEVFMPERFLGDAPQKDPRSICFGFGRRICPGLQLADASVFISVAMSLAVFDMAKAVEDGTTVEPVVEKTPGTISHPVEYKCQIKPRSPKAVAVIQGDIHL